MNGTIPRPDAAAGGRIPGPRVIAELIRAFPPVLAALDEVGHRGLVAVELPRHTHAASSICRSSLAFLRAAEDRAKEEVA